VRNRRAPARIIGEHRPMPLKDSLLAVLVVTIWGTNFVVVDAGLEGVPALLFLAMRFVVVLLPAVFIVPRPRARWQDVAAVGAFMSLGQFGLLYLALEADMPPGLASLVLQAQVLFTVLIASLTIGERPSRRQLMAVLVGGVGLVVVAFVGRRRRRSLPSCSPWPPPCRGRSETY